MRSLRVFSGRGDRQAPVLQGVTLAGALLVAQSFWTATPGHAMTHAGRSSRTCAGVRSGVSSCAVMPARGTFSLSIPGTPALLYGAGTPNRAGKEIRIQRVPLVCQSLGGFGIHIYTPASTALLPPLHWSNGTLYYRDRATNQCKGVASPALAAAPGVYQVVPGSGVSAMPRTGGAAGGTPGSDNRWLPAVLGIALIAGTSVRSARRAR